MSPARAAAGASLPAKSGSEVRVGDVVSAPVAHARGVRTAVVRFVGKTGFAGGDWAGLELGEPEGRNDGSVQGARYFECRPGHGVFVRLENVSKISLRQPLSLPLTTPTTAEPTIETSDGSPPSSDSPSDPNATSGAATPTTRPTRWLSQPSLFDDIVVEGTVEGQRYRRLNEMLGCPASGRLNWESFVDIMRTLMGDLVTDFDLQQEWEDAGCGGMTMNRLYTLLVSSDHYHVPDDLDQLLAWSDPRQEEHPEPDAPEDEEREEAEGAMRSAAGAARAAEEEEGRTAAGALGEGGKRVAAGAEAEGPRALEEGPGTVGGAADEVPEAAVLPQSTRPTSPEAGLAGQDAKEEEKPERAAVAQKETAEYREKLKGTVVVELAGSGPSAARAIVAAKSEEVKWNSVGYEHRGDAEAVKKAENADFIISFCASDKEQNNGHLKNLQVYGAKCKAWGGKLKPVNFCTDRSLGMGKHYVDGVYEGRTDRYYDFLDRPDPRAIFPPWFEEYKKAYKDTKYGLLIATFSKEYMKSKACRWEFGYLDTERFWIYVPEKDEIVAWSDLHRDPEALKQALKGEDAEGLAGQYKDELMEEHCAQPLLELNLRQVEERHGVQAEEFAYAAHSLAMVLRDASQQKELFECALSVKERHHGSDHFKVASTLVNLAVAEGHLGDVGKKKELLERALTINERHFEGTDNFEVASTLVNLANAEGDLGDVGKKKQLLERALTIEERHFGTDNFEVASTLVNLANAEGDLGDVGKKKQLLERALTINERHFGTDHFQVAITLYNLGAAELALGDAGKAKELFERTLSIDEGHYGRHHSTVADTLEALAIAEGQLGNARRQEELLQRAARIRERRPA